MKELCGVGGMKELCGVVGWRECVAKTATGPLSSLES